MPAATFIPDTLSPKMLNYCSAASRRRFTLPTPLVPRLRAGNQRAELAELWRENMAFSSPQPPLAAARPVQKHVFTPCRAVCDPFLLLLQ